MRRRALLVLAIAPAVLAQDGAAADPPQKAPPPPPGVVGTRAGISDAWIAADAAVDGVYRGPDSTLGPQYHVIDVQDTWMGTPARGRLVFKVPRGIRGRSGQRMLLFLWDRLAGAPDSYLEESKARYGEGTWKRIGPDSLTPYLLPFSAWSYPYDTNTLVLRGQTPFPTEVPLSDLRHDLETLEASLRPENLYKRVDVVMRARVTRVEQRTRTEHGLVVERAVAADFLKLDSIKGAGPDSLHLHFVSVPRSPRFRQDDEVILFLVRGTPETLYLDQGKRCVLHVVHGEVLEAGRPLSEFLKLLRGS